jgi:hypothetical protein
MKFSVISSVCIACVLTLRASYCSRLQPHMQLTLCITTAAAFAVVLLFAAAAVLALFNNTFTYAHMSTHTVYVLALRTEMCPCAY